MSKNIKGMVLKVPHEHYFMCRFNKGTSEKFPVLYHYSLLLLVVCDMTQILYFIKQLLKKQAANTHIRV